MGMHIATSISLSVGLLILLADLLTKTYISKNLSLGQSIPIIKNIFHLSLVHNTGIAFGLLKDQAVIFVGISLFALAYIFVDFLLHVKHFTLNRAIALGLLLGGACGNLIDRMRLGYIIDFLDFRVWPVFNIADSAITLGIILLGLDLFVNSK